MQKTLYRKYRPANLDEIYGQKNIVKILKNQIENNKISHAYVFSGPKGSGKTSVAKIFSKIINCTEDKKPCELCVSCTQNNKGTSVDVLEIDAASNNGVDEVRELKSKINLVPTNSKYKVYIIDEVHMMTTSAFNALLKVLEEPPVHSIFILATTDFKKIPGTIVSRCQVFEFKKINEEEIVDNLERISNLEKIKIDKEALLSISKIASGSMRDAIGILDQCSNMSDTITSEDVYKVTGTVSSDEIEVVSLLIAKGEYKKTYEHINAYLIEGKNLIYITEMLISFHKKMILENLEIEKASSILIKLNKSNKYYLGVIQKLNKYLVEMKKTNLIDEYFELMFLDVITEFSKEIKTSVSVPKEQDKEKEIIAEENSCENLFEIRINNTLSNFNKSETKIIKEKFDTEKDFYLSDNKYKKAIKIIDEIDIKAVGKNNIIFVCQHKRQEVEFYQNIEKIEALFEKINDLKFNTVCVDEKKWDSIKAKYNSKKEKYIYQEEPKDTTKKIKKCFEFEQNEISDTFGSSVKITED
jgi:DNA polymerase-3 subunit gamma/tau